MACCLIKFQLTLCTVSLTDVKCFVLGDFAFSLLVMHEKKAMSTIHP